MALCASSANWCEIQCTNIFIQSLWGRLTSQLVSLLNFRLQNIQPVILVLFCFLYFYVFFNFLIYCSNWIPWNLMGVRLSKPDQFSLVSYSLTYWKHITFPLHSRTDSLLHKDNTKYTCGYFRIGSTKIKSTGQVFVVGWWHVWDNDEGKKKKKTSHVSSWGFQIELAFYETVFIHQKLTVH